MGHPLIHIFYQMKRLRSNQLLTKFMDSGSELDLIQMSLQWLQLMIERDMDGKSWMIFLIISHLLGISLIDLEDVKRPKFNLTGKWYSKHSDLLSIFFSSKEKISHDRTFDSWIETSSHFGLSSKTASDQGLSCGASCNPLDEKARTEECVQCSQQIAASHVTILDKYRDNIIEAANAKESFEINAD